MVGKVLRDQVTMELISWQQELQRWGEGCIMASPTVLESMHMHKDRVIAPVAGKPLQDS